MRGRLDGGGMPRRAGGGAVVGSDGHRSGSHAGSRHTTILGRPIDMAQHSETPPRLFPAQGEGTSLVPGAFLFLHVARKFCGKFSLRRPTSKDGFEYLLCTGDKIGDLFLGGFTFLSVIAQVSDISQVLDKSPLGNGDSIVVFQQLV